MNCSTTPISSKLQTALFVCGALTDEEIDLMKIKIEYEHMRTGQQFEESFLTALFVSGERRANYSNPNLN